MVRSSRWLGRGRILCALLVAAILAVGAAATAAGDDRATTEAVLKEVEASPRKEVAGDLVTRSRAALDRAERLRSSGDEAHAKLADRLARTWAEAARDVARAAVVEESAATQRRGATDAGALADRERALLEEAIAQSGRLRAQLDSATRNGKEEPARTSTAAVSDAGTRAPAKPAAKDGAAPKDGATVPKDAPQTPNVNADGGAR
ncbi:MAG: hypothetical protein KF894_02650 [Labilithrix sp.]|nr:hypothetical protein [Labilithrix sp.]